MGYLFFFIAIVILFVIFSIYISAYKAQNLRCPFCGEYGLSPEIETEFLETPYAIKTTTCRHCGKVFDDDIAVVWENLKEEFGEEKALREFNEIYGDRKEKEVN